MKIRLRFIDLVVSLFIYAGSIITFAFLHYEKGLDTVISLLLFTFNFAFFFVMYQGLILLWNKNLKYSFSSIASAISKSWQDDSWMEKSMKKAEQDLKITVKAQVQSLDVQFRYVMHYLGPYLKAEEYDILREDLRLMAYEEWINIDNPPFKRICKDSLNEFNQKDINHLGHAIGHHTIRHRTTTDISIFLKSCFPQKYSDCEITTIASKLTCIDYYNIKIPVEDKKQPLPFFNE